MKLITKHIPEYNLKKFLDIDLEEIYMYCAVNCIENPYIADYIKKRKQIEDEENTNEREETSQYPPIISYDELANEEELSIQPSKGRKVSSQMMLLLLLIVMMIIAILLVLSILLMMRVIMLMI